MERHVNKFVLVWALALTAFLALGLTVPNNFSGGTVISSAQMNANFAAVEAAVSALEAQAASPGNIRGMVKVESNGTVTTAWMANGGTPTVSHTAASGIYDVTFPGETITGGGDNPCMMVTPVNGGGPPAITGAANGFSGQVRVRLFDAAGALVDGEFWVLISGQI